MQQCRSTVVHVSAKPELRLDPPSATVYRGDSVRIRCLSSDIDQSNGYSWTKNNALFQSDAETELWEDLYPDGSILKINNIQVIYIHYTGCPFAQFYTRMCTNTCLCCLCYRRAGVCGCECPFLSSIPLVFSSKHQKFIDGHFKSLCMRMNSPLQKYGNILTENEVRERKRSQTTMFTSYFPWKLYFDMVSFLWGSTE